MVMEIVITHLNLSTSEYGLRKRLRKCEQASRTTARQLAYICGGPFGQLRLHLASMRAKTLFAHQGHPDEKWDREQCIRRSTAFTSVTGLPCSILAKLMTNWGPIVRTFAPCLCIALCIAIALQLTWLIQLFGLLCPGTLAGAFRAFLGDPLCLLFLCLFILRRISTLVPRIASEI